MVTEAQERQSKSRHNEDFDTYLKNQCLKTTFNGLEIESFTWYKKMLGIL